MTQERVLITAIAGSAEIRKAPIVPLPPNHVRVRTHFSGVSAGTELLILGYSEKPGSDPHNLGYQLSGVVKEVSAELSDRFEPGDKVACYGGPYVHHSTVVDVPRPLVVKLRPEADLMDFCYCGLGAVAMHGFRCGEARLGETVAVVGLGVLGNLSAQVAAAAGCRVMAFDGLVSRRHAARENQSRSGAFAVAESVGELACTIHGMSDGNGADAVLLAVNSCSDELLAESVKLARHGGRVVLLGVGNPQIPRELLFQREVSFMVSRAAGPGRYDRAYEYEDRDYPYAWVRWTEGRNLEEFVRLVGAGLVNVSALKSYVLDYRDAPSFYPRLKAEPGKFLGAVMKWKNEK